MNKLFRKAMTWILVFSMTLSLLPTGVFAFPEKAGNVQGTRFYEKLVDEMAALSGSREKAETILTTLYKNGLVDETGTPLFGDVYLVDGEELTYDELVERAENNAENTPVNIDGIDTTWGDIQQMLLIKETLSIISEYLDTGAEMTADHIASLESLLTQLGAEGVQLMNNEIAPASLPASIPALDLTKQVYLEKNSATPIKAGQWFRTEFTAKLVDSTYFSPAYPNSSLTSAPYDVTLKYIIVAPGFNLQDVAREGTITIPKNVGKSSTFSAPFTYDGEWNGTRKIYIDLYDVTNARFYDTTGGQGVKVKTLVYEITNDADVSSAPVYKKTNTRAFYGNFWDGSWKGIRTLNLEPTSYLSNGYCGGSYSDTRFTHVPESYTLKGGAATGYEAIINPALPKYTFANEADSNWSDTPTSDIDISENAPLEDNKVYATTVKMEFVAYQLSGEALSFPKLGLETTLAEGEWFMSSFDVTKRTKHNNLNYIYDVVQTYDSTWRSMRSDQYGTNFKQWRDAVLAVYKKSEEDFTAPGAPRLDGTYALYSAATPIKGSDLKGNRIESTLHVYSDQISAYEKQYNSKEAVSGPGLGGIVFTLECRAYDDKTTVLDTVQAHNTFRPGMTVPLRIDFDKRLMITDEMKLTVNGVTLTPANIGAKDKFALFEYTVKNIDTGTPTVTNFVFGDTYSADAQKQTLTNPASVSALVMDSQCKLETPDKASSFTDIRVSYNENTREIEIELDIDSTPEPNQPQNLPYRAWIAQNCEMDTSDPMVLDRFYVKSLYAVDSNNSSKRIPLYVDDEINPTKLIGKAKVINIGTAPRVDNIYFFLDPNFASQYDYIADEEERAASYSMDLNSVARQITLPATQAPVAGVDFELFVSPSLQAMQNSVSAVEDVPGDAYAEFRIKDGGTADEIFKTLDCIDSIEFTSTNSAIATMENFDITEPYRYFISPTGTAGNAGFRCTVKYGAEYGYDGTFVFDLGYTGDKFYFKEGMNPFLIIPAFCKNINTFAGTDTDVLFTTNIPLRRGGETPVFYALYELDADGNRGNVCWGYATNDGIPVWIDGANGHQNRWTIPGDKLRMINKDGPSYEFEVRMNAGDEGWKSDTAFITLLPQPLKATLATPSTCFEMDSGNISAGYSVVGLNPDDAASLEFMVINNKDGSTVYNAVSTGSQTANSGTFSFAPQQVTSLKDIYTVSVKARNSDSEAWSMDSYLIYVYNANALDILVQASTSISSTGDKSYRLDNENFVNGMLSSDGKSLDLSGTSMGELREDVNLSTIISMKYGQYAFSLVADQIKWKSSDSKSLTVDYFQGGYWADIEAYNYVSYAPATDFLMVGHKDSDTPVTVTATHARADGIKSQVEIDVSSMKEKLYLFQMFPKVQTTMVYTNGNNEDVTVESDTNGQLALYEPFSINSRIELRSEVDGEVYMATIDPATLETGEKNVAALQVYPLNVCRLVSASSVTLFLKNPNGTPYANKSVTLRGGVFKNGEYCPDTSINQGNNGRTDQLLTTDSLGKIKIDLDPTTLFVSEQEKTDKNSMLFPDDKFEYVFELRDFQDGLRPTLVRTESNMDISGQGKAASHIVQLASAEGKTDYVFTDSRTLVSENTRLGLSEEFNIINYNSNIGPSNAYDKITALSTILFWGTPVATDGDFSIDEGKEYTAQYLDDTGLAPRGQSYVSTVYPFSTMPVCDLTYVMDDSAMNGWLDMYETKRLTSVFETTDGETSILSGRESLPCVVQNLIGAEEPTDGTMKDSAEDFYDLVSNQSGMGDMMQKIKIVEAISSGMTMVSGAGSGGDYAVGVMLAPTENPLVYNVVITVGEPQGNDDGVGIDYEAAGELIKAMSEDEDDDDDDDGAKVEFKLRGAVRAQAVYTPGYGWSFDIVGGSIGAVLGVSKEWKNSFFCGPVPVVISIKLGLELSADIGFQSLLLSSGLVTSEYLVDMAVKIYVDAFAGVGIDYSLFALKIGIFGKFSIEAAVRFLDSVAPNAPGMKDGQALTIAGEIGLKFVCKILVITYEKNYSLVAFEKKYTWRGYDAIESYWEGRTQSGSLFSAMALSSGEVLYTIESATVERRDYLDKYERVWMNSPSGEVVIHGPQQFSMSLASSAPEPSFEVIQTNSYPFSNPVVSEDGKMMVFLSDAGSSNVEKTVASFATRNADGGYTMIGAIAELDGAYGDSALTLSGSGDKYFATWIRQTESIKKEAARPVDDQEIAMTLNSTEIFAAVYDAVENKWTAERLTDNMVSDLSPTIASNGDEAVVAWRNVAGSNSDDPFNFNIINEIQFSRLEENGWSEPQTMYNGTNGAPRSVASALMEDGTFLTVFTVKTNSDANISTDTEVFYSVADTSGDFNTVRITNDGNADENAQAAVITNGDGEEEFVIAWYTESYDSDGNKAADVRMAGINSQGLLDSTFCESIGNAQGVVSTFKLSARSDFGIEGMSIVWTEPVGVDVLDNDGAVIPNDHHLDYDVVKAVKFYTQNLGGTDYVFATGVLDIAQMPQGTKIDNLEAFTTADDKLYTALLTTDYSANENELVDTITEEFSYLDDNDVLQTESEVIGIYAPVGESKICMTETAIINSFAVTNTKFDKKALIPGLTIPVRFTVSNDGIAPLDSFSITMGSNPAVNFTDTVLPGKTASFIINYQLPDDNIVDVDYLVACGGLPVQLGTIALCSPDISVENLTLVREEGGERDVSLSLRNNSFVNLYNSGKKVKVGLYADKEHTSELIAPVEVLGTDLQLIDFGAHTIQMKVDVADILDNQHEGAYEIPDSGAQIFAKAWIENDDSENSTLNERVNLDNIGVIRLFNLATLRGEGLSVTDALKVNQDGSVDVDVILQSNTMAYQNCNNILVKLLDKEGNVVSTAVKESYNGSPASTITLGSEERKVVDFTFDASEIETDAEVFSVQIEVVGDEVTVSFDLTECATQNEQYYRQDTVSFGGNAAEPEEEPESTETYPGFADYVFEGWYADAECTVEFDFAGTVLSSNITIYAKWTVNPHPVVISGIEVEDKEYDGLAISPIGTPVSIDEITGEEAIDPEYVYSYEGTGDTIYAESDEAPVDSGTYKLTITIDNDEYTGSLELPFEISQRQLTLTGITVENRSYDGTTVVGINADQLHVSFDNLLPDDVGHITLDTGSITASVADKNAGNGKEVTVEGLSLVGNNAENYTLGYELTIDIAKVTLTALSDTGIEVSKTYDGSTDAGTLTGAFTFDGKVLDDDISITVTPGGYDNPNAGENKTITLTLALSGDDKDNYTLDDTSYTFERAVIEKAVYASDVSLDVGIFINKEYEQTGEVTLESFFINVPQEAEFTLITSTAVITYVSGSGLKVLSDTPVLSSDTLIYTSQTDLVNEGDVDTFEVTIESANYEDIIAELTFTSTNKFIATIAGVTISGKEYDGTAVEADSGNLTVELADGTNVASECGTLVYTYTGTGTTSYDDTAAPIDAGTYKLTVSVSDDVEFYRGKLEIAFTITKATITITADDKTAVEGDDEPEYTYSVSGLVLDEALLTEPTLSSPDADMDAEGEYEIIASGAAAPVGGNYKDIVYVNGTLSVSSKTPVTISGVSVDGKSYDGAAASYSGTPVANDGETDVNPVGYDYKWQRANGTALTEAPKNAGSYKLIVSVSDSDRNYIGSAEISFTISKATITVTADNKTGIVGGDEPEYTYTVTGLASNESLAVEPTFDCSPDMDVIGEYVITPKDAEAPSGENYEDIVYVDGTLNVREAIVTFNANGGIGTMDSISAPNGPCTLPLCMFSRGGYLFNGWNTEEDGNGTAYANGETITLTEDITLYAQWQYNRIDDDLSDNSYTPAPTTPAPAPKAPPVASVIVDGKAYNVGTTEVNGNITTVVINHAELEKQLATAKNSVVIPVTNTTTDTVAVNLVVKNVDDIADRNMTLSVQVGNISYDIPAGVVDTKGIMEQLGASNTADVSISISITNTVDSATKAQVENAVMSAGGEIVIPAIQFTITATYDGKTVEVSTFSSYVGRTIEVTEAQANKVTTAIVVEPNGTTRHVPTRIYQIGAKRYVEINSRTNSTYTLIYNDMSFTDTRGKWYEATVNEMAGRMVISGIGDNLFAGDRDITRAEFAAIIIRALGLPAGGNGSIFTDVSRSAWYYGTVGTAYEYGLISGVGNNQFAPDRKITRQEAMVMIQRAAKITGFIGNSGSGNINTFIDTNDVSDWALDAAKWNVDSGLISGFGGKLNPTNNITRAETATLVLKLLQKSKLVDVRN